MKRPQAPTPPLLDLLGASWNLDAPVTGVAWDGGLAGFALGDGSLAMARAEWNGAPKLGMRDGGGLELTPGTAPHPPVARQSVHRGACLSLAADPDGGFLTGGDDGVLALTSAEGEVQGVGAYPGSWVDLVAVSSVGWRAWAVNRHVYLSGLGTADVMAPGSVTALAFDPAGDRLAIAYYHGVTLWQQGQELRVLATQGCPRSIAWSPDGAYVICGLQENALHGWRLSNGGDIEMGGYPGQPRSLAFSADGRFLASSGAPRVVCWPFDPPGGDGQPTECGIPASRMPVCMVACHPTQTLIAAGYHNGAVLLCQPGHDDVLFAKGSSGGSVTALAWSADGARLAMGTEGGEAGVVALPGTLFRFGAPRRGRWCSDRRGDLQRPADGALERVGARHDCRSRQGFHHGHAGSCSALHCGRQDAGSAPERRRRPVMSHAIGASWDMVRRNMSQDETCCGAVIVGKWTCDTWHRNCCQTFGYLRA